MVQSKRFLIAAVLVAALVSVAGCKHKEQPQPVATAPPVSSPAPTAQITASPGAVTAGDQVVLRWNTRDATSATIDGLGDVPTSGVKTVMPTVSTSYRLVAHGSGGTADAEARVTVNAPPAVASAPAGNVSAEQDFKAHVRDIFFDYDKYTVRNDAQAALAQDAAYLESHPNVTVVIGGYCDERGSEEYNMALGQNRAEAAKKALINAGIPASRIRDISFGKEKQFCTADTDACYQQNRRDGFAMDR